MTEIVAKQPPGEEKFRVKLRNRLGALIEHVKEAGAGWEVRQVLSGEKPGATIPSGSTAPYEKLGLDVVAIMYPKDRDKNRPSSNLAIALPGSTVDSVMEQKRVPQIPKFQDKIDALLGRLRDKSIARAIAELEESPRQVIGNRAEPEVVAVEGLLFGYKSCCIEYFINTRYLDTDKYTVEKRARGDEHTFCQDCAKGVKSDI